MAFVGGWYGERNTVKQNNKFFIQCKEGGRVIFQILRIRKSLIIKAFFLGMVEWAFYPVPFCNAGLSWNEGFRPSAAAIRHPEDALKSAWTPKA